MQEQYISTDQNDDVLVVNELLQIMNHYLFSAHKSNSLDGDVQAFIVYFAQFLYTHLGVNDARIPELLQFEPNQPLILKLFSTYTNNSTETDSTLGCPLRNISLKHIHLRFHEVFSKRIPGQAQALLIDLQKALQKKWKNNTTRKLDLKDTGLNFNKKSDATMRLITEKRPLRIAFEDESIIVSDVSDVKILPECRFKLALQEFLIC